jgi:hypothetical protein
MGVFGSPGHLEFTLPFEISHLIQVGLRFCDVFVSPYVLEQAQLILCLVAPYG